MPLVQDPLPADNTPGYVIQALRNLSINLGYYTYSERGRQQLKVKRQVGDRMLQYGYCVYIDEINTDEHPEQGRCGIGIGSTPKVFWRNLGPITMVMVPAPCAASARLTWKNCEAFSKRQEPSSALTTLKRNAMIQDGKKRVWCDYQKEIATDHYYYARSCIRQNFFPGSEETFLKIVERCSVKIFSMTRTRPPAPALRIIRR